MKKTKEKIVTVSVPANRWTGFSIYKLAPGRRKPTHCMLGHAMLHFGGKVDLDTTTTMAAAFVATRLGMNTTYERESLHEAAMEQDEARTAAEAARLFNKVCRSHGIPLRVKVTKPRTKKMKGSNK